MRGGGKGGFSGWIVNFIEAHISVRVVRAMKMMSILLSILLLYLYVRCNVWKIRDPTLCVIQVKCVKTTGRDCFHSKTRRIIIHAFTRKATDIVKSFIFNFFILGLNSTDLCLWLIWNTAAVWRVCFPAHGIAQIDRSSSATMQGKDSPRAVSPISLHYLFIASRSKILIIFGFISYY